MKNIIVRSTGAIPAFHRWFYTTLSKHFVGISGLQPKHALKYVIVGNNRMLIATQTVDPTNPVSWKSNFTDIITQQKS